MIKWLILLPIISIILNQYLYISIIRITNILISIILLYISLYIYLYMDNTSMEYQYRESIDMKILRYSIGIDGISLSLIILLNIIFPILLWIVYTPHIYNKLYYIYIVLIIIFISLDILIFFIFFEVLLIPMFLLIGMEGTLYRRREASYRFLLYTYMGSLFMLLSIINIYMQNGSTNLEMNIYSINNNPLVIYFLLSFIFLFSFLVKLPMFPFHTWLPVVHVESSTIGSILLAGILLKIATYGIYRFSIPLFTYFNNFFILPILILILLSVYYISFINIRQIDLKKIIAYSSIVHMNFSLFGLLSNDINGIYGALYSNISHGIISSLLFFLIGLLYIRFHSRIIYYYNNLANIVPIFSVCLFISILHNIAIPLSSSFISELYILISSYKYNIIFSLLLFFSLFFSTIYNIWLLNRLLFNNNYYINSSLDLSLNELIIIISLLFFSFLLGISPSPLLSLFSSSILSILY
jgi:NADH-quinone oxidoreductase subunit M